jgi:hypothetical protein
VSVQMRLHGLTRLTMIEKYRHVSSPHTPRIEEDAADVRIHRPKSGSAPVGGPDQAPSRLLHR